MELSSLRDSTESKREYEDGCAALRNKRAADAENHLRKAVKQYPKYSAAWVLLGQTLAHSRKQTKREKPAPSPSLRIPSYRPATFVLLISRRDRNTGRSPEVQQSCPRT